MIVILFISYCKIAKCGFVVKIVPFEDNEIGRAFYDAYGFEVIGERPDEDTGFCVLRLKLHG